MKFKHPLIRVALSTLWYSFATLAVSAAVLLTVARLFLPFVEDYRAEAEQILSEQAGRPVRIAALHAEWSGFGPRLRLADVSLYDDKGERVLMRVSEVRLGIDLFASMLNKDFVPSSVTISGVNLSLKRHFDGSISVHGFDKEGGAEGDDYSQVIAAWLFKQKEIGIESSSIYWSDEKTGVKDLFFADVYLRLRNDQIRHQVEGSLVLPGNLGKSFSFAIDLQGDLLDPENWLGELYVNGRGFVVPQWWPRPIDKDIRLAEGMVDFELWGKWQDGRAQKVEGNVNTHGLKFAGKRGQKIPFTALESELIWLKLEQGWRLQLSNFVPSTADESWPGSEFSLISYEDEDRYEVSAGFVRIADILEVLNALDILDKDIHAPLFGMAPEADLNNLVVRYAGGAPEGQRIRIDTDFSSLRTTKWKDFPAVENLAGHLVTDLHHGYISLDSKQSKFDYTGMFREVIELDSLQGELYLKRLDDGWQLKAENIRLANRDIKLESHFTLQFNDDGSAPIIDLIGSFSDGDGRSERVGLYLPIRELSDESVAWLDRALLAGKVPSGGMILRGPLDKFPFEGDEGKFEVRFDVVEGTLDYQTGWPLLEDITAEVVFSGKALHITADSARIFRSDVKDVRVYIDDLDADNPLLTIHGKVDAYTDDVRRYLIESEVGEDYRDGLQRLRADGRSELVLKIDVPLGDGEGMVDGEINFVNSQLGLMDKPVSLEKLSGVVTFRNSHFTGKDITGELLGIPLKLDVTSSDGDEMALAIVADANFSLNDVLQRQLDGTVPTLMEGKTDWQGQLLIPQADAGYEWVARLVLSSSLAGAAINLPEPLGKAADSLQASSVWFDFSDADKHVIGVDYGDTQALFEVATAEGFDFIRGDVRFGGDAPVLTDATGLSVSGDFASLSADKWRQYFAELNIPSAAQDKNQPPLPWLNHVDLAIRKIRFLDMDFLDTRLKIERQESAWLADVVSDRISGRITVPYDTSVTPVKLDLDVLKLHSSESDVEFEVKLDPGDFPSIELTSKEFYFNEVALGKLSVVSKRGPEGQFMERLLLTGPSIFLQASGDWSIIDKDETTRLSIKLKSDNFSGLLESLGYRTGFDAGKSRVTAQLQWPGGPLQFALANTDGSLQLRIKDGRLQDISPGAGRIFGLLSLQALPRRLTLDFSDLFKKGFSFDEIKGNFQIEQGNAYTTDLFMEAPAAHIDISGRTGLAEQDYDQLVTVTPNLTASLPVAGALLGGPIAGGVLFAIDKLFKPAIDDISRIQYSITGSWDEPVVEKLAALPAVEDDAEDTNPPEQQTANDENTVQ